MQVTYSAVNGGFDIPLKVYSPDSGSVKGKVLAVHGFGGSKESAAINMLAGKLTGFGMEITAFDLPCHGKSGYDGELTLKVCRESFRRVLDHVKGRSPAGEPKAVFATSFGGYLALLELAELSADVRIVLRAPAVDMKSTFRNVIYPMTAEQFKERGAELGFDKKFRVAGSCLSELEQNDISERDMHRDMLILHGSGDRLVLPEHIERFVRANPAAALFTVEGADHRFSDKDCLERAVNEAVKWIIRQ